jgi:hypothetical protein
MKTTSSFQKMITNALYFKAFLLFRLPLALIAGIKIDFIDKNQCKVALPFKWLNKNPFGSMYFASLSMASELSTGLLVLQAIDNHEYQFSILVKQMKGNFEKKGMENIYFLCHLKQELLFETFEKTIKSDSWESITIESVGKTRDGEICCTFEYEWAIRKSK